MPARSALFLGLALALGAAAAGAREFQRDIQETRPAEPGGTIDIINVAGRISVQGWDQPQLEVSGTVGAKVERVEVSSAGGHASVRVVLPASTGGDDDGSAWLTVRVPQRSALNVSLVSADLEVAELDGEAHLRTVSGNVSGALEGDAHVNTVSGDVQLKAPAARNLEVKTISGNVNVYGAGGNVEVGTVSGDAELSLGTLQRGRFQTVSGDFGIGSTLAPGGDIDAESVSGDVMLRFATAPDATCDLQSFSGDIDNCFGPKPADTEYGPGTRLSFSSGSGAGHVRVETKSGDVSLCTRAPRQPRTPQPPVQPAPALPPGGGTQAPPPPKPPQAPKAAAAAGG
ncbi:MAG: DUF4097 family beta strand repeat-containing protein [Steroidobacteraceae bacterium]